MALPLGYKRNIHFLICTDVLCEFLKENNNLTWNGDFFVSGSIYTLKLLNRNMIIDEVCFLGLYNAFKVNM